MPAPVPALSAAPSLRGPRELLETPRRIELVIERDEETDAINQSFDQ